MTSGNSFFEGCASPSTSIVQRITSSVDDLSNPAVARALAKYEFTISSWVSHHVAAAGAVSDRDLLILVLVVMRVPEVQSQIFAHAAVARY
jgi:hypothetical protein